MKFLLSYCLILLLSASVDGYVEPVVLVHGGVDNVNTSRIAQRAETVKKAAMLGFKILRHGGSVADAVEGAVKVLEEDPNINAGYGSTLNADGEVEMDAAIMVGFNLNSGSVSGVKYFAHPISLARLVMDRSPHFGLAGEGAHRFAKQLGLPLIDAQTMIAPHAKRDLADYLRNLSLLERRAVTSGSAGAVALDEFGHVAAATSSGGRIGKIPGRVSDSAVVGAGLYASDDVGAVAVTAVKIMQYFFVRSFLALALFLSPRSRAREPIMLIHGGTDSINQSRVHMRLDGLKQATTQGYRVLKSGGSVTDAVETALRIMEDDGAFNAGYGSVLNIDGHVEMSACMVVGENLSSGGVTALRNVQHPISVARLVMERTPYFLLHGEGASKFAQRNGVSLVSDELLITLQAQKDYNDYLKATDDKKNELQMMTVGRGDVGAIAMDAEGHLAAGASSGGRLAMMPGRISASAVIGSGVYAEDRVGAAVVTGHGEAIARYVMASEIINAMKRGFEAGVATRNVVKGITERFRKPTGAITLSKNGQIGISFTTDKMAWAYQLRDSVHYGVDDYDHFSERIKI